MGIVLAPTSLRLHLGSMISFQQDSLFLGREAAIARVKHDLLGHAHERAPLVERAGVGLAFHVKKTIENTPALTSRQESPAGYRPCRFLGVQ
jgi:hypothetical protein